MTLPEVCIEADKFEKMHQQAVTIVPIAEMLYVPIWMTAEHSTIYKDV